MDEQLFTDATKPPTKAELAEALGRSGRYWEDISAYALESGPEVRSEWKKYTKKSGWTFVVRGKKRNVVYMGPRAKHILVGFLFAERTVQAAKEAGLPASVLKIIDDAPKYPEGRGVRIEVRTAADAKIVKQLIAIRVAN